MRVLTVAIAVFMSSACTTVPPQPASVAQVQRGCAPLGAAFVRTTLYFGLARPTGMVSEAEWQAFLRDEVTPRFPDGLTVWEADGQWRRPDGSIGRERAKVLLIVHDEKPVTLAGLGALVTTYKEKFTQESVLWETARVCAAF